MRLFTLTSLFKAIAVFIAFFSPLVTANSFAIKNATVYTATEAGILNDATVVVTDGVISAINPSTLNVDHIIDAKGKVLTPGLIGSLNSLGLIEVNAVARSRDGGDDDADITFDASLAFNPKSTLLPYARKGGITSNIVAPDGGKSMFKGQSFVVDLSGNFDSVRSTHNAVIIDLGSKSKGSRAMDLQKFIHQLEDAQEVLVEIESAKKNKKSKEDKNAKKLKRDEKVINELLAGNQPLVAYADRATDLLALIQIKQQFGIDLIFVGASDAVLIQEELLKANIPVILDAYRNLPSSFDGFNSSLESASILMKAGIKVGFYVGDAHKSDQLRYSAGIAIANGVSAENAMAAITSNIADIFQLDVGRVAIGKKADLVLWSSDLFEISTKVETMWINGEEASTYSRQDALRDRYTTDSKMPRAYTK